MFDAFNDMDGLEKFYTLCAIFGGLLFVIRLALQFLGGDSGFDDMDVDIDGGDADLSFKVLSFQGLTSFFMMFGLVGIALRRQSGVSVPWSMAGAMAAGLATVWVIGQIFSFMKGLQSSGTVDIQNAVGQEGTVYLTIPAEGTGKARLTIQDHLKVLDAISEHKVKLETGQRIRVVRVVAGNLLAVEKAE